MSDTKKSEQKILQDGLSKGMSEFLKEPSNRLLSFVTNFAINRNLGTDIDTGLNEDNLNLDDIQNPFSDQSAITHPEHAVKGDRQHNFVDASFQGKPAKLYRKLYRNVSRESIENNLVVPKNLGQNIIKSIFKEQLDNVVKILVNILSQATHINPEFNNNTLVNIKDKSNLSERLCCVFIHDILTNRLHKDCVHSFDQIGIGYTSYIPTHSTGGIHSISYCSDILLDKEFVVDKKGDFPNFDIYKFIFKTLLLVSNSVTINMQFPKLEVRKVDYDIYEYTVEYYYDILIRNYSFEHIEYPNYNELFDKDNWLDFSGKKILGFNGSNINHIGLCVLSEEERLVSRHD
ncbi:MAG: hypothetical protein ACOCQD_01115 [archaeon]